jgi:hypothetical protein
LFHCIAITFSLLILAFEFLWRIPEFTKLLGHDYLVRQLAFARANEPDFCTSAPFGKAPKIRKESVGSLFQFERCIAKLNRIDASNKSCKARWRQVASCDTVFLLVSPGH